jgi:two-component system, response regulator YesN
MFRALIVDDIEVICKSIAMKIQDSSFPIISGGTASNGEVALNWLEHNYVDFCITDIKMPVMDGLEMIRQINMKYPWIVTIILSSYDDFEYARKSIQLEAVDYIIKPVDQDQLDAALSKAIDKTVRSRLALSDSLLLSRRGECSILLNKWVDCIKLDKGSEHEIIRETVENFAEWVVNKYYLMEYLALEWLKTVATEVKANSSERGLGPGEKKGKQGTAITSEAVKEYYYHKCTELLQSGLGYVKSKFGQTKGAQQSKLIEKLNEYIEDNYRNNEFSLQEMADHVALSKSYMCNMFKHEMGDTIWNKVIELRMKKAKELLSQIDIKIYEVATSVGYNDYIHFSRLFKEYNGISAQDYRRKTTL